MKFRNIPHEVEAVQFTGSNVKEVFDFCPYAIFGPFPGTIEVPGVYGYINIVNGEYIIKTEKGLYIPMKPEDFLSIYEPIK